MFNRSMTKPDRNFAMRKKVEKDSERNFHHQTKDTYWYTNTKQSSGITFPNAVCKSKRFGNQERIFGEIHQAPGIRQTQ